MKLNSWSLKKKLIILNIVIGLVVLCPLFYFLLVLPRAEIRSLNKKYIEVNNSGRITIVKKRPQSWVDLKEISKFAAQSIVISEDWAFYMHGGYDLRQIYQSIKDAFFGRNLRGASTISQQVVKNIFLSSRRSYIRKIHEFFFALYLERHLTKTKILTLYLNLIELGPEIYGIKKASWYYFQKGPSALRAREGAFLAMLLPSPIKYGQSFRNKKLTVFATKTVNRILNKMVQAKLISREDLDLYKSYRFSWELKDRDFDFEEEYE